ncbi:unnamed protein product [Blepharisma stoltei]|uniref:Peptidase C1A papain C-terminal domain-containing protein n=1 Tax=Blepharisma stoltei TaxID=1481888 RepID=A0AAU9IRY5_9CILI|nr:unnamed protein product [Blepharisma stoltei]
MKYLVIASLIALAISGPTVTFKNASPALKDSDLVAPQEMIDLINQSQDSWTASADWVGQMTIGDAKSYASASGEPRSFPEKDWGALLDSVTPPSSFDSRQQWPNCIHPILNQEQCGSCWAFGATEALSDRLCIASKGSINVVLSPQYLLECDKENFACNGGIADLAWLWMKDHGVPTYSCVPYLGQDSTCPTACSNGSQLQVYKASSVNTYSGPSSMQAAILAGGPIEVTFQVYQDFMTYSGGIYKHTTGNFLGNHCVKVVGWGTQNGTNYWVVANSWGTSWGIQGFFNIAFGQCGIDSQAVAGTPLV